MSVSGISKTGKIQNIDPKAGKFAVNYNFNWHGLTPDVNVLVPGMGTILGTGIADIFSPLLRANAAAGIPPIKWVQGIVSLLPQSVAETNAQGEYSGGLYLVSPDTGVVIALEQTENAYRVDAGPTKTPGLVNPGTISFSLPLECIAEASSIQVIKLADTAAGPGVMNGYANISFLTYEGQVYLRGAR